MKQLARLSADIEDKACDMILDDCKLDDIAKAMGLKNRRTFQKYLIQHAQFASQFDAALMAQCMYLEEELLHCADRYNKDSARVKMESIHRILKFRNPKRYGDKIQAEVNMNIDLSNAIDAAERRVFEVAATNVIAIGKKDTL